MTFPARLKKTKKPTQSRLRFDLEKLRNPDVADTFQATISRKCAPLINLRNDDIDIDSMITTYNTAVTFIQPVRYLGRTLAEKALGNKRCSGPLLGEEGFEEEAV